MEHRKILLMSILVVFILIIGVFVIFVLGGREKPSPIAEQCAFACESRQKPSFCDIERVVNDEIRATCDELSTNSQYSGYNIVPCPGISCEPSAQEADQTCVTGLGGKWETRVGDACPQSGEKIVRKIIASDESPVTGQICCR